MSFSFTIRGKNIHFFILFLIKSMYVYSIRIIWLLTFSILSIFSYYFLFPFHGEQSNITLIYVWIIAFLYACYKAFTIGLGYKTLQFSLSWILSLFFLHVFILCYLFFVSHGGAGGYSLYLFFRIAFFAITIGMFFLVTLWFWKRLLSLSHLNTDKHSMAFQLLLYGGVGFSVFLILLSIVAILSWYTLLWFLWLLFSIAFISYKEILYFFQLFSSYRLEFDNHDIKSSDVEKQVQPYLLSTEFLFLVTTLVISVSFISVIRPFPIGWDDLWVYMNYPKLIAAAGWNIALGQMYSWQLFTGIWFLFKSQSFAFFLNSFASILAFFSILLGTKIVLWSDKAPRINLWLLMWTVFLVLPMVIFQVTKDMKLDVGLFALSFAVVSILVYIYSLREKLSSREYYIYLLIVGIILWVTFVIKVTSLLLISWILAIICFFHLWIAGFISYVCFYIAIFTFGDLWGLMNVVYPSDSKFLIYSVSGWFLWSWIAALAYSMVVSWKTHLCKMISAISVVIIGICITLLPWQLKHISEASDGSLSLTSLIWWKSDGFRADYTLLYDEETIQSKVDSLTPRSVSSTGSVQNEDFGRYFWYEAGINNYLKLPWNLSMQVNQKWEFTDITYIFLALLPGLFMFLPYRRTIYMLPVAALLVFEVLYFSPVVTGPIVAQIFGNITLPVWYIFIFFPLIASVLYFYCTLDRSKDISQKFLLVYVFAIFYVFLWTISAFGVVWYGIVMYGAFLLLIVICTQSVSDSKQRDILMYIVFGIISFYLIQSAVPHALSNLEKARYIQYKSWQDSEHATLFKSHPEYLEILFAVNVVDDKKQDFIASYRDKILVEVQQAWLSKEINDLAQSADTIESLDLLIRSFSIRNDNQQEEPKVQLLRKHVSHIWEQFYTDIISPQKQIASDAVIYRVGTFLKYFITSNNSRLLEDSLLTTFDTYFYDESSWEKAFSRMKQVWIDYMLIDLNAATIDNDPRKDLTRRYENLITGLTSGKLDLVKTDSYCLSLGLHEYKKNKDIVSYMEFATVNHPSNNLSVSQKIEKCRIRIVEILVHNKDSIASDYPFLLDIQKLIQRHKWDIWNPKHVAQAVSGLVGQWFKALVKIQD